jgi:predicted alpha-1,2-mannosidase
MKNNLLSFILSILSVATLLAQSDSADLNRFVNPFIGTANNGNTFPGAVVPWGMLSVSPHTSPGSPSGYIYGEKFFYGFGHVHLSGTGCADLGSIIIMPTLGELRTNPENYRCSYSNEKAEPGYYQVMLEGNQINSEVTAQARSGIIRITVAKESKVNILIDVGRSLNLVGGGKINLDSERQVSGFNIAGGFCGEANRQTVYFASETNHTPLSKEIWVNDSLMNDKSVEVKNKSMGCWISFQIQPEDPLLIKTGISYVSSHNARQNVESEIPGWNFESVKRQAQKAWQEQLSRVHVEGGSQEEKVKFYTALYHMLIHPNILNDMNGEYPIMGRKGIGQ